MKPFKTTGRLMKNLLKKILSEELIGYYDYIRYPEYKNSWGGPFNGQKIRQQIFLQIIINFKFDKIVETGTYRGCTTEFMSKHFSSKIFTVESNKRSYGFSRLRFLFNNKIIVIQNDSRKFLNQIFNNANLKEKYIFIYLDAHWEDDLPLIEELQIIFNHSQNSIVMIDDFQVPNDKGYEYDDYGPGKRLTVELLNEINNIYKFFPSQSSDKETGARRGSIVLTNSNDIKNRLLKLDTLKYFE
jgi:predicted O-methyltransferase YrrM